jgi:hypothetical protein
MCMCCGYGLLVMLNWQDDQVRRYYYLDNDGFTICGCSASFSALRRMEFMRFAGLDSNMSLHICGLFSLVFKAGFNDLCQGSPR